MRTHLLMALIGLSLASCWGQEVRVGSKLASVTIRDSNSPVVFSVTSAPATVIVFVSTRCPISNAYNDRMNSIFKEFSAKGVQFAFVNANSNESRAEVDQHAKANQFAFRIYKDTGNALTNQFGAEVTPEVFVFDKDGVVQYHGHVDDSTNPARVQVKGLHKALDAVLSGQPVEKKETKAFGCTIKKART